MLLASALLVGHVAGHGMMSSPPTRNSKGASFVAPYYASCAGYGCLWFSQGCSIGCKECSGTSIFNVSLCGSDFKATITDPKYLTWNFDVEPLGADDWTQFNPWRAPGSAPVYDSCGMAGGGQKKGDPGNGGVPPPGHRVGDLGSNLAELSTKTFWKPGGVVEVAWAIDANHGGGYQYRLCPKKNSPSEECFFKTPLAFVGSTQTIRFLNGTKVEIPAVYVSEGVEPAGSSWARNPIPACGDTNEGGAQLEPCTFPRFPPPLGSSKWGPDSYGLWGFGAGACESGLAGKTCTQGKLDHYVLKFEIVDKVQIPADLPEGDYHLGFRWDAEQTPQVWSSCADVTISSGSAPPAPPSPPAPSPAPRPQPFSQDCLDTLEGLCGKFTPHGKKTSATNCNGCIGYHPKEIVPVCGGWQPSEGGVGDFQAWCKDKYVPPAPTPPTPPPTPLPIPSPSPPYTPGGCNDPTGACTDPDKCSTCQGTCETLETGACAACWAVDPTMGHACLSDDEGDHGDCRNCWYPTPSPSPPVPSPEPSPSPAPEDCPGGSLPACMELCPTSPDVVYTACVTNCGNKCADPSPSPVPPVPVPVPAPTPSPVPTPTGGCHDATNACTGVCAPCKGTCETLKTSFCAQCWAVDPTLGTSCLSDTADNDCRDCWHPAVEFV